MTSFEYFVVTLALSLLTLGINLPALALLTMPLVLTLPHLHPTQRTLTTAAIRALDGLMTYPDHVVTAVHTHIVHNLPTPLWLTNWLMLVSTTTADTREYAVWIDCHLTKIDWDIQAQSDGMISLYQTMGTLAERVTTVTGLLSRLPEHVLSIQLTTTETQAQVNSLTDDMLTLRNHISTTANHLLTSLDHCTSLSADVDLQLCLDNIHRQLDALASAAAVANLQEQLEVLSQLLQPPPPPHHSQVLPFLHPLPASQPLSPLATTNFPLLTLPTAHSAPASPTSSPTSIKSDPDSDKENVPVHQLPPLQP